jgi:hypothetical protein
MRALKNEKLRKNGTLNYRVLKVVQAMIILDILKVSIKIKIITHCP